MDFIDRPDLPAIVAGMSDPELKEFRIWCLDCLGSEIDDMRDYELDRAARIWFSEIQSYMDEMGC